MGLLDLKTDLKSLKYGKDRPGGGDSKQPYIKTDINTVDRGFNELRLTKFDDGLIRGGAIGALNASVVDTLRIGKFFLDLPKGPLFLAKQIGLQLSNPQLETKQISLGNKTGILGFVSKVANTISNNFGPTRIYNLGINTLAQVPVNAFGKHFNRHGLTPVQDDNTKYFAVVNENNKNGSNRLLKLKDKLIGAPYSPIINNKTFGLLNTLTSTVGEIFGFKNPLKSLTANQLNISDYSGGPGSVYGIGRTVIRRYDYTDTKSNITPFQKERGIIDYGKTLGLSNLYFSGQNVTIPLFSGLLPSIQLNVDRIRDVDGANNINLANPTKKPSQIDQNVIKYKVGSNNIEKYKQLRNTVDNLPLSTPKTIPFSTVNDINFKPTGFGPFKNKQFKSETNSGLDRTPNSPFRYYGKAKSSLDGSQLVYDNSNTYSRIDSDILTNVFTIIDPFSGNEDKIFLSSYMKGFKEDFSATWNDINYAGRAESFYVYNKFKRTVSFNLQIPCFNRKELFEKHRALGQLAATTAGSYNNGFLGGVLIKLNIGNYIVGEYSILNSLNYSIPDDASWDITPEGRLAMLIDTSFNFTIIHKELPQYKSQQGFFKYLPDQVSGYLEKGNRTQTEQSKINLNFSNENYEKYDNGDTKTPTPVIRLRPNDIPLTSQSPFRPTIDTTIKTPDTLKSIDLRTGKTPNQLRGYVDNPINNPTLPTSQTPFA
jgi:hypothetical protein